MKQEHLIEAIIGAIERNFTDREGLKQAWEDIGRPLRVVICAAWAQEVKKVLDAHKPQMTPDERLDRLEKKVKKLERRLKGMKGGRPPMR